MIQFSERVIAILVLAIPSLLMFPSVSDAIDLDPFGPNGEGGALYGQFLQIGSGGEVFELNGYLNIAGQDLNGAAFGTSAQLTEDLPPAGLLFGFSSALSGSNTDLTLTYTLENKTGAAIENLSSVPRPMQSRKLVGSENSYRLRVGRYRVLYQVYEADNLIVVFAVAHRREVYR